MSRTYHHESRRWTSEEVDSVEFSGHTTGHSSYYEDRGRGFAERGDKFCGDDDPRGFWIVVELNAGVRS